MTKKPCGRRGQVSTSNKHLRVEKKKVEDVYRDSARVRFCFLGDLEAGVQLERAMRNVHARINPMFTQMYGGVKTFFTYLE